MAVTENGQLVEKTKVTTNGIAEAAASTKRPRPTTSWTRWLITNTARLAIWYALLTVLFRCPSDPAQLDASAPQICKHYLTLKAHVQPHVQPYYDTYASPYVEKTRPYVEHANARVVAPTTIIARQHFDTYAAPHLNTARAYGQQQWEKAVLPQLVQAQAQAAGLYHANVAPHVSKASEAAQPYYTAARDAADNLHKNHLLPAYFVSRPYLDNAANSSHHFVFHQASPLLRDGWTSALIYVDGTLWPFVKGLYIDNVRPQLVMINERIAKYQESRKLQAVINDDSANAQVTEPASDAVVQPPAASSSGSALDDLFALGEDESSSAAPSSSVKPQAREVEYVTDESAAEDLRKWQEKFALAADKGTDDLKGRVSEIASSLAQSDIDGLGKPLASALELTAARETDRIKDKIKSVVAALPDDASVEDVANAEDEIIQAVRESGLAVKDKAVNVREWAKKFEAQLNQQISAAATTTLEVLDGIRDLGLQEVGMRWAWSEGVTYKHWAKYHELRKTLDEWRSEVLDTALGNEDAVAAKATALQILEEAMAHTEAAAKQLVKLREAAKWKIRAKDHSDDFEPREILPTASSTASSLAEDAQGASSSVEAAESESALADEALGSVTPSVPESAAVTDAILSSTSSVADDVADSGSPVLVEAATEASESATTEASELATAESSEPTTTEASDDTATEESPSTSSYSVKASSFIPGAEAQEVKASAPILDDQFDDSSEAPTTTLESLVNQASSSYSEAISQAQQHYEDAKSIASAQISDTTKPIHKEIFSSIESAFAGAQAAASSRLQSAISAVSAQYSATSSQATPTQGPLEFISSIASSHLQAALEQASAHYSNVKSAIGAAPTSGSEEYLSAAQQKFYAALDFAHVQYSDFVSVASNTVHETLGPAYSSASSVASENWESLVSVASDKVYGSPTAVYAEQDSATDISSAGSSLASEAGGPSAAPTESVESVTSPVTDSSKSAASISTEESDSANSATSSVDESEAVDEPESAAEGAQSKIEESSSATEHTKDEL